MQDPLPTLTIILGAVLAMFVVQPAAAQERWFQVEMSVFTNESPTDRNEEYWQTDKLQLTYPSRLRQLDSLSDYLSIDALLPRPASEGVESNINASRNPEQPNPQQPNPQQRRRQNIQATGPFPPASAEPFQFADFSRSAFLRLPDSASDFQQTNRALERSPEHRLLFHGLWRQPVVSRTGSEAVYISGGTRYGDQYELQGSLGLYFNADRTRIMVDANLWLSEFSTVGGNEPGLQLPPPPVGIEPSVSVPADTRTEYYPRQIYHLNQTRPVRSDEFHYLDHPALGVIITVTPYELPSLEPSGEILPPSLGDNQPLISPASPPISR